MVRVLAAPSPALARALEQACATLRDAVDRMPATRRPPRWPRPADSWRVDLLRIADHVELFLALVELARRAPAGAEEAAALVERGLGLLRRLAREKAPYLLPAILCEHWALVAGIERTLADETARPDAPAPWHA